MELSYAHAGGFVLSPDGKNIGYILNKSEKHFIVVSPWEFPSRANEKGPYDGIGPLVFVPGTSEAAFYVMKNDKWRIVIGDKEGPAYSGMGASPVFNPDGVKVAYAAMKDDSKWVMVSSSTDNLAKVKESKAYDMVVSPVWSPDGRYIAYRARNGTMEEAERFIVIADAETAEVIAEGPVQDEVWPPVWSSDSKFAAYGTRKGRNLWWRVEAME